MSKMRTYSPEWLVLEEASPREMHYIPMSGGDAREYEGTESIWVVILDHVYENEYTASVVAVNDSLVGSVVPIESTGPMSEDLARIHMEYYMKRARSGIVYIGFSLGGESL